MISSVRIRGFRCLDDLKLQGFHGVNLLTGKNNTGKTAFLEAMFLMLAAHDTEIATLLQSVRGMTSFKADPAEIWGWLFRDKRTDRQIEIEALRGSSERFHLTIRIDRANLTLGAAAAELRNASLGGALPSESSDVSNLRFEYGAGNGPSVVLRARMAFHPTAGRTVEYEKHDVPSNPKTIFLPNNSKVGSDDVRRFSVLQDAGGTGEVVAALKLVEPDLRDLRIGISGDQVMVVGDVGKGAFVPLAMMGDGIGRFLSLILAIFEAKDGHVLVDEIESGFHYSVLDSVWRIIREQSAANRCQVLATTHSIECVRSAQRVFEERDPFELGLFRLERDGAGRIQAVAYDREGLAVSAELNLEVR